jgi:hypothetical protein
VERNGSICGVRAGRGGPSISHLFFADDSLLFGQATQEGCLQFQSILQKYEAASGQQLNREKTSLFFSKNTPHDTQDVLAGILGIPIITCFEKYLRLPSFVGQSKKQAFSNIQERVWSKLKGWKEKFLS